MLMPSPNHGHNGCLMMIIMMMMRVSCAFLKKQTANKCYTPSC